MRIIEFSWTESDTKTPKQPLFLIKNRERRERREREERKRGGGDWYTQYYEKKNNKNYITNQSDSIMINN